MNPYNYEPYYDPHYLTPEEADRQESREELKMEQRDGRLRNACSIEISSEHPMRQEPTNDLNQCWPQ